jgi:tRNA pseudouridine38-40 synthase
LPFLARYGFFCGNVNKEKLADGLQLFVGTHDFRSFCTGDEAESTIRTIDEIELMYFKRWGVHRIAVKGPGFLRYMIRRIVGACLDVASSQKSINELVIALDAKDPHQHLHVAPAHGLVLHGIRYSS